MQPLPWCGLQLSVALVTRAVVEAASRFILSTDLGTPTLGTGHSFIRVRGAKCRRPPKLAQGIEPWTSTLPRWRSTAELCQRLPRPSSPPQTHASLVDTGR